MVSGVRCAYVKGNVIIARKRAALGVGVCMLEAGQAGIRWAVLSGGALALGCLGLSNPESLGVSVFWRRGVRAPGRPLYNKGHPIVGGRVDLGLGISTCTGWSRIL